MRVHVIAGNKIIIIFNGVWKGRILQFNNHDEDLIYLLSINAFLSRWLGMNESEVISLRVASVVGGDDGLRLISVHPKGVAIISIYRISPIYNIIIII